jgi:isoquinoline 1-oxidoreductase subunit beta
MSSAVKMHRREFIQVSVVAGTGLMLGVSSRELFAASDAVFQPNVWLQIAPDNTTTVWLAKSEMGQGVYTALPMIVAEELEADWTKIRVEKALASHDNKYGSQGTGGSGSVRTSYERLRKAGATAREMLITAAAQQWNADRSECRAENGSVVHSGGKKLTYGELAEAAAKVPVPENPPLKDAKDFRIIGKRTKRLDTPSKTDGSAKYGLDVRVPGMLYASIVRSPVLGGKVESFNATAAKRIQGVKDVVQIENGVAVVADSVWPAVEGRKVLTVKWHENGNAALSSASIRQKLADSAAKDGAVARNEGDAMGAIASAAKDVQRVYEVPFLAHSPMEPMNCTAHVQGDKCEIWAPNQVPQSLQREVAGKLSIPVENVKVNTTLLGGGFGRRLDVDYAVEAAQVSKAIAAPVKVVWTREDDMQHGYFRPTSYHKLAGGVDASGKITAWSHRVVAPSITGQRWPDRIKDGMDPSAVNGAANLPYAIPNIRVEFQMTNTPVPTSWWRSVYNSQNAFVNECFLDELAVAAGRDPFELRRELLKNNPRLLAVLELAAEKAGWGRQLPKGRGMGIASHFSFESYVAEVAEVSVDADGKLRVHRVVCAVDCGTVINPDTVEAQMEGSVVYALSSLKEAITVARGRIEQQNFDTFPLLRNMEMPKVETYIVPSSAPPTGIGEPAVPPAIPAVLNAVFAATGKRIRKLPIKPEDLAKA